jgi:hypothetical protein
MGIKRELVANRLEEAVKEEWRSDEWPVYPQYELIEVQGHKFVYARSTLEQIQGCEWYQPLSTTWAGLFLNFANLAADDSLDQHPLDSDKNEAVALKWAHEYGVLGLTYGHKSRMLLPGSDITAHFLGLESARGLAITEQLNEARGGYPNETVARFAFEAWQAHVALRLFEAAKVDTEGGPDLETIMDFMPERSRHISRTPESLQSWALSVVKDSAQDKVAGRCYPRLHEGPDGYARGWGFNSLLGAMWLQMLWVITGTGRIRRCLWCGDAIALESPEPPKEPGLKKNVRGKYKTRTDKNFCDTKDGVKGKCKGLYHYHYRVKPARNRS